MIRTSRLLVCPHKLSVIYIGMGLAVLASQPSWAATTDLGSPNWTDASVAVIREHSSFANITMWYFVGVLVVKTFLVVKKKMNQTFNYVILALALIGCFFVFETSEHGGQLVTKFGIGTELNVKVDNPDE